MKDELKITAASGRRIKGRAVTGSSRTDHLGGAKVGAHDLRGLADARMLVGGPEPDYLVST